VREPWPSDKLLFMVASVVAPVRSNPRITLEEWANLPEDEPGEIVAGELVEEEVAGFAHEVVVTFLVQLFLNWLGERGFVGGSDARFAVRPQHGRKPDLTVFLPGGRVPPRRGLIQVPPDIAVEVITSTPADARRDRVEKLAEYADFGIPYYWLVDPDLRTLEIYELGADKRYTHALAAAQGVVSTIPGCEGLVLDLSTLWARVERLG
jgi:Uma2 family endonuclease